MSGPFGSSQWMYKSGGYEIANSLRTPTVNSGYLNITPDASNRRTFTWSFWVKRANHIQYSSTIVDCGGTNDAVFRIQINYATGVLGAYDYNGTSNQYEWTLVTNSRLSDFSAWYHIVVAIDTTQGTNTNRGKIYINGVDQVGNYVNDYYPAENYQSHCNSNTVHKFSGTHSNDANFVGNFAEVNFIDGAAKTPADFGETGDFGEWKPIEYKGSYGDNGFYFDFKSAGVGTASSSTVGADRSGNDNHWTSNGLAAHDQMIDTPTNNFATFNPLVNGGGALTLDEGNLGITGFGSARQRHSTIMPVSGKWYAEFCMIADMQDVQVGIANDLGTGYLGNTANSWGMISATGNRINSGSQSSYGSEYVNGGIVSVALDLDNGKVFLAENNTFQGSGNPVNGDNPMYAFGYESNIGFAVGSNDTGGDVMANFGQDSSFAGAKTAQGNTDGKGQGDFFYTPPSGYLALCTKNLTACAVTPSENFSVLLNAGDSSADEAFTTGFQTDWVWSFIRSTNASPEMVDSVRGVTKVLVSDTDANETTDVESVISFNSNGFTLGTNSGGWNRDSRTYVYYSWRGGTAFSNDASATSVGSIDSAGKVNAAAGFSIIGYTGNGTNGATVAHGLSKKPEMIWVKNRSKSNGESWCVYVSAGGLDATDQLQLNSNGAFSDTADAWNDTEPTTSVFSISGDDRTNDSGETFIAYCFHSVDGYCKIGSWVGNAADNAPFVYTGFRPKWVMYKKAAGSASWFIVDTARNPGNKAFLNLSPDTATDENTSGNGQTELFILSNGFKPGGAGGDVNGNNEPYIYLAFAESPFKNSNAR